MGFSGRIGVPGEPGRFTMIERAGEPGRRIRPAKRTMLVLFLLCCPLVLSCARGPAASPNSTTSQLSHDPPLTPPPTPRVGDVGTTYSRVHFCTDGTEMLRMEIRVPHRLARDPAPVLLNLGSSLGEGTLVERGYVVASVPWRQPPSDRLPVGIADVKCAVRYLRAHASQYHIDPDSIGAWECSRGGYMAAMVGLADASAGFEGTGGFEDQSSRLQAVVVLDGIASFRTNYAGAERELQEIHGIPSLDDPLVDRLSPVTYVSPDDPPFLLIVSEVDNVPYAGQPKSEMQQLHDELAAGGVPVTLQEVENAAHCSFPVDGRPSRNELVEAIVGFFEQHLQ